MGERTITTADYKLFASPRNVHREIFEYQVFVPYPYTLIDLQGFFFKGKASLYSACRLSDMKMGQVVTLQLAEDEARFRSKFVPD
jgi:hypothetical protein